MSRARRRLSAALLLVVVAVQTGAAGQPACSPDADPGETRDLHHGLAAASAKHGPPPSSAELPAVDEERPSSPATQTPESCVTTLHCGLSVAEAITPVPASLPDEPAAEGTSLGWFVQLAALGHGTPPPRA